MDQAVRPAVGRDLVTPDGDPSDQSGKRLGNGPQHKEGGPDTVLVQQPQDTLYSSLDAPALARDPLYVLDAADMIPVFHINRKGIQRHNRSMKTNLK
jgi:hypothetical protein